MATIADVRNRKILEARAKRKGRNREPQMTVTPRIVPPEPAAEPAPAKKKTKAKAEAAPKSD